MGYDSQKWDLLLPSTLLDKDKERLKRMLEQFIVPEHKNKIKKYDDFYLQNSFDYFLQGDILKNINSLSWDYENSKYTFANSPVILLSNTCDVSKENKHIFDKQALYAPVTKLDFFVDSLREDSIDESKIVSICNTLKRQEYSNIFYLPPNPINKNEYIVLLDNIFWQPSTVLKEKLSNINDERFLSLNHFGFYLLITKLSYHFCRTPEETDR